MQFVHRSKVVQDGNIKYDVGHIVDKKVFFSTFASDNMLQCFLVKTYSMLVVLFA